MGSSSTTGASSGTSEGVDQQVVAVVQRKRKRMLSNRESARRSRMRKQKHLDELASQAGELKKDNAQIVTSINVSAQLYARVEAQNSVLRAQMAELTHRLQSLNDIINCIGNASTTANSLSFQSNVAHHEDFYYLDQDDYSMMTVVMNNNHCNSFPIMATPDQMCMY